MGPLKLPPVRKKGGEKKEELEEGTEERKKKRRNYRGRGKIREEERKIPVKQHKLRIDCTEFVIREAPVNSHNSRLYRI